MTKHALRGGAVTAALAIVGALAACGPTLGSSSTWPYKCEAPIAAGQPCVSSSSCQSGLFCSDAKSGNSINRVLTCEAQAAAGAPCRSSDQCAAGYACTVNIDQDGQCFTQTCDSHGACTLGAKTASKCPIVGGVQKMCPKGEGCILVGTPNPGTCVARPKLGGSCTGLDDPNPCETGLVCGVSGTCIAPPSQGQACAAGAVCAAGLVCITDLTTQKSTCELPRTLGQSCYSGQCAKGTHCDLKSLVCKANVGAGSACPQGNECGEPPLDVGSPVSCVMQKCVQATGNGSTCEPSLAPCGMGLVCDR